MNITMLMENTPYADGFLAEHGLSIYIETDDHHILFDMGQSDGFITNAQTLGVDLDSVDIAILSHGHYDHGGGLDAFLRLNHHAHVYINQYAFEPHFHGADRSIGINPDLASHPQVILVEDKLEIDSVLSLCACNDWPRPYLMGSYGLNAEHNGVLGPDAFYHEQYLTITENGQRIVISGCSHKGVLNIMNWLAPDYLIGGFHFMNINPNSPEREVLDEAAHVLMQYPAKYFTCHCTGLEPYQYLKSILKDRLDYLASGQRITII